MSGDHLLDPVFRPRSVVVVGASSDPRKRGHQVLVALDEAGYEGRVHPVNPRGGEILGHPVHASLDDVPGTPDLALICTPASTVPDVVEACGRRSIRGAVVLAVGFRESGEAGATLERRLVEVARAGGVRVVGPNTSGILNLPMGLNLIGARGVRPGSLSLLVQSGNMALALMNEVTSRTRDGIAVAVGVGNQADLGFAEYLDFLGADPATRAVMVYAEGFRDARAFLEVAARVTRDTPVLVIKGARSRAGQEAARSHTGSVAGEYDRLRAGFQQAGVVEVTRSDELLHVAQTLAHQPPVEDGRGIAILSDGGGQGTLAADALAELDVPLAGFGEATRERLRELLGEAAGLGNPVDLAGAADADPGVFGSALSVLAADPGVGGVLMVGLFGGYGIRFAAELTGSEVRAAREVVEIMDAVGKPLVVHSMYAAHASEPLVCLGEASVPVVESLEVACRCIGECWRRGRRRDGPRWNPAREPETGPSPEAAQVVATARAEGRTTLTEPESRALLREAGAMMPRAMLCPDDEAVRRAFDALGGPVALKVVSPRIPHKTEAGGVALGLTSAEECVEAFRAVAEAADTWLRDQGERPGIDGVLLTSMLQAPVAELLVGARRDPDVGPVLTLGSGGIWVEILGDVTHRVLPVDEDEIEAMLAELRIHAVLAGARGRPVGHRNAVVAQTSAVARCLLQHPEIAEVEVNPLFVHRSGAQAVDARIFLVEEGR